MGTIANKGNDNGSFSASLIGSNLCVVIFDPRVRRTEGANAQTIEAFRLPWLGGILVYAYFILV